MDASNAKTSTGLTTAHKKWFHNFSTIAFNGHKPYNEFIGFFQEACPNKGCSAIIETDRTDYQSHLRNLGCQVTVTPEGKTVFTLTNKGYHELMEEFSESRRLWHYNRQVYLRNYLIEALNKEYIQPLDISYSEKTKIIRKYGKRHRDDGGSYPMQTHLARFIEYQLAHPDRLVEWKMYGCMLIETHKQASVCKDFLQLMRGILGIELVFRDDDVQTVVDIETNVTKPREPCDFILVWRMNPNVDFKLLRDTLKVIPKQYHGVANRKAFTVTEIPTAVKEQSNVLINCLDQCLFYLRK